MINEEINKIIKNYAHDYRDMKMSELELFDMLCDFLDDIKKNS